MKFNNQSCGRYKWTVTQWLILILKSGLTERYNDASCSLSLDLTLGVTLHNFTYLGIGKLLLHNVNPLFMVEFKVLKSLLSLPINDNLVV